MDQLLCLVRVSLHWSEATVTTPNVGAMAKVCSDAHLRLLIDSRLRSQVGSLRENPQDPFPRSYVVRDPSFVIRSVELLELVSMRLSGLRELHVRPFSRFPHEGDLSVVCLALSRMSQLRSLHFFVDSEDCVNSVNDDGAGAMLSSSNRIIRSIGEISAPMLHTLHLRLSLHSSLSFAPLRALAQLRRLRLSHAPEFLTGDVVFSDTQIDELRSLTQLSEFDNPYHSTEDGLQQQLLKRILQPGHKLQWSQLSAGGEQLTVMDFHLAPGLASLPTLTDLSVLFDDLIVTDGNADDVVVPTIAPSLSFFHSLRQLTSLSVRGYSVEYDELPQSIAGCSQLTSLTLGNGPIASRHLEAILPCFPRLSSVSLFGCQGLGSLRCFDSAALSTSLTRLTVKWCFGLSRELHHLLRLRSLVYLEFHGPLDPEAEHRKAFLPRLGRFPRLEFSTVS